MTDDHEDGGLARQLGPYAGGLGAMFARDEPPCKEGVTSEHTEGVAFFAPWEDPFAGFPEHARRLARALGAGTAVHLRSTQPNAQWEGGPARNRIRAAMAPFIDASIGRYLAQIYMLVPSRSAITNLVTHPHLDPEQLATVNRFKVFYTVWERQWIGADFARALNRVGQLWTACEDNRAMLVRAGIAESKVVVVPCPYFDDDPLLSLDGRERKPGPVRFYHIGKWEPRKNQDAIIGAFLRAFTPGEAMLILKTSSGAPLKVTDYPRSPEASIAQWLEDAGVRQNGWTWELVNRFVVLRRQMLKPAQIVELHRVGDVYVTLSRGEGFDMPAFDSKLAGNLMVYVPSGGPQDFAGVDDERVDVTGTVPCHPFYGWEKEATYYDYDFDDAVRAMRRAYDKAIAGKRTRGRDLRPFSADVVAAAMHSAIARLA